MPMTFAQLVALSKRHRTHAEVVGLAAFAFVGAVTIGAAARRRTAPLALDLARGSSELTEIASFRAAFRPPTPTEDARETAVIQTLSFGTPHELRVALVEQIATLAERAGLRNVRVSFATTDSASPPPKPNFYGADVPAETLADYTLAVDCAGTFNALVNTIASLPTTVALQRVAAEQASDGVHYHIALAVYEAPSAAGTAPHG